MFFYEIFGEIRELLIALMLIKITKNVLAQYSTKESNFLKYRMWRGFGSKVSEKSRLGLEITYNNENPRTMSSREIEIITKSDKAVNIMYFWPIKNILEIMARNGKIIGKYLNAKQGWMFEECTLEEIKVKHKFDWKVRHESYEEFREDLETIRDYRVYHADKELKGEEAEKVLDEMLEADWTMNSIDGYVKIKHLWNKYKADTTRVMNLEFRLRTDMYVNGLTETPIVIEEDKVGRQFERSNPIKLQIIEKKWSKGENLTSIPMRKKKQYSQIEVQKGKTKEIYIGNDELLKEMREIKMILLNMKETSKDKEEMLLLDKVDQIREIERSIYDEETKEKMKQIILSRWDPDDLKYKVLEDKLLTGINYMIEMPKIEKIRTNILGMVQEIENCDTSKWKDDSIVDRLQIVTGNRIKKMINAKLEDIMKVLVVFRKEMDIANDLKSICEDKKGIDLHKFKDLMRTTIEENEYKKVRFEFLERWCLTLEECCDRGFVNEDMEARTVIKKKKRKYVISDDENEEEEQMYPKGLLEIMGGENDNNKSVPKSPERKIVKNDSLEKENNEKSNEVIEISSEEKTEELTFIEFSSSEDEN